MHKILSMLEELLSKYENARGLNPGDVEMVHKLTDTMKNIYKIKVLEEQVEGGQSERRGYSREGGMSRNSYDGGSYGSSYGRDGGSYRGGSYGAGDSYDGGSSERRKRDSMGRYSRDDGREDMMRKLRNMIESARTEEERDTIKKCLHELEQG